jgi:hypothetical protein
MLAKLAFSFVALVGTASSSAAIISSWGFESLAVSSTAGTSPSPTAGSLASDTGNGNLSALHTSTATVWSTPAGNGSSKSLSANNWSTGDFFEFTSNTTGNSGIQLVFDATRSGTGPADFKIQYSLTGTGGTYVDLPGGAYNATQVTFSSANLQTNTPPRFYIDMSTITGLDNNPNASFRLTNTSAATAAAGTHRVDNITVGTNIIPEPATIGLAGLAGVSMLVRRHRD